MPPLPTAEQTPESEVCRPTKRTGLITALGVLFMLAFVMAALFGKIATFLNAAPANFPIGITFIVEEGSGAKTIVQGLAEQNYLRSYWWGLYTLSTDFKDETLKAGTYTFTEPLPATEVFAVLVAGNPVDNTLPLTLIEGERATQIAARAAAILPNFDTARFLELAIPVEGQLYPDTYFVPPDFTADLLFELLHRTYKERLALLESELAAHPLGEEGVITLASIIEREANDETSMRIVSGILQNRLAIGMALQTDASIEYVLDKPLGELTPNDLTRDTPYNTYLYPGLPPTPIGNPGLSAIMAVLDATSTDYFFYITGNDGNFYYAKTFDEHRQNIAQYLR